MKLEKSRRASNFTLHRTAVALLAPAAERRR